MQHKHYTTRHHERQMTGRRFRQHRGCLTDEVLPGLAAQGLTLHQRVLPRL